MSLSVNTLRQLYLGLPGIVILIRPNSPDFSVVALSQAMAAFSKTNPESWYDQPLFFPYFGHEPLQKGIDQILSLLEEIIQSGESKVLEGQRFDIPISGTNHRELYWDIEYSPIFSDTNQLEYIQISANNVTERHMTGKTVDLKDSLDTAAKLIHQTGIAIHILEGPEFRIRLANRPTLQLWGEDESVLNRPFFEVLPELKKSNFLDILQRILQTGKPFIANELEVKSWKSGREHSGYFNISIQPFFDNVNAMPAGVVAMVTEVSEWHRNKVELDQKRQSLAMATELGALGLFTIYPETKTFECSPRIREWFGFPSSRISLNEAMHYIHPDDMEMVNSSYADLVKGSGRKHKIIFRTKPNAQGEFIYLRSVGQVHSENGRTVLFNGILQDVTNEIEQELIVENALKRQEQIIASAPMPMAVYMGQEMIVELANDSMKALWGKGLKVYGKSYYDLLPELRDSDLFEKLQAVYSEGKAFSDSNVKLDILMGGKTKTYYINNTLTPLQDADGMVYGVLNTCADVTEVNVAKNAIEKSKDQYRFLFDQSSVAAGLYIGKNHIIQYANNLLLHYWMQGEEVIGKPLAEVVPQPRRDVVLKILDYVYNTGETYTGSQEKVLYETPAGRQEYYMNYTFKAVRDSEDKIIGVYYIATDITSEFIVKKALIESEENLRNMILQAPFAICILWGDQYVMGNINSMMEELLGKSVKMLEGLTLFEAVPEMDTPEMRRLLSQCYDGERVVVREDKFQFRRKNTLDTVYLKYHYEPLRDSQGMPMGIMVLATDVTQEVNARIRIEEIVSNRTRELAETNQRLQQSNAELEQFAYIASHDLQEPLRKISMFTQMLEISLDQVNERARHQMDRINNSVRRMSNLIQDILTYSQITHRTDIYVPIDLNRTIKEIQLDFDELLHEKQGQILLEELPIIEGVPAQMNQLFGNLISNSLKYSRVDVPPKISISSRRLSENEREKLGLLWARQGYVKIVVKDNGIGFQQEYAERIFQIFQRLHSKTQFEGTGIGLAMCRRIVENHRGHIAAEGVEGKGATFKIILPIEQI